MKSGSALLRCLIFGIVHLIVVLPIFSQSPAVSYGEQFLTVNDQECMRRVPIAYRAEGFNPETPSVNTTYGSKGIHSAYIRCLGEPEKARTRVIIVVASSAQEISVPGTERVNLQRRMEQSSGGQTGQTPPNIVQTPPNIVQIPPNSGQTPTNFDNDNDPNTIEGTWRTTATGFRGKNGTRITLSCPSGGSGGTVWGTDYYTDDSTICAAAVHQGMISYGSGGRVIIEITAGLQAYTGSTRYGVTSGGYGAWHGSFVFVR